MKILFCLLLWVRCATILAAMSAPQQRQQRRGIGPSTPDPDPGPVPSRPPLHDLDALSLSRLLASGDATAVEVMECALDRIDSVNPRVNAIVSLRGREELLSEARESDEAARGGESGGWLRGVPTAVKDMSDARGLPTTRGGSPLLADAAPAPSDDPFVRRLRSSGAIIVGKTNSPEMGLGSHTYNPTFGPTLNPYDPTRSAGGSSGGAGAALACRMLWAVDGSDMMGSLRNPAGWGCGYSHRPTAGLMEEADATDGAEAGASGDGDSDDGAAAACGPLPYPISTAGPMARTPLDCARLLQTMVGEGRTGLFDFADVSHDPDVSGLRVGWLGDWGGAYPMEDGILRTCRGAMRVLEGAGAEVVDVAEAPFPAEEMWKSWTTVRSKVIATNMVEDFGEDFIAEYGEKVKPELVWEVERGLALTEGEVREAVDVAAAWSERASELLGSYDALALPTAQTWPFPVGWVWPKAIAGREMDSYHRWMEVVVPVTLGGLPCATVPAGFGGGGLPIGVQLFGGRGGDAALLEVAQAYHLRTDWPGKRPPDVGR